MGELYELDDPNRAMAMFKILLKYSIGYHKKNKFSYILDEVENNEVFDQSEYIRDFMKKHYEKTGYRCNKIYKNDIFKEFQEYSGNEYMELRPFVGILKTIGYSYDRQMNSAGYKSPKGCFYGLIKK